MLTRLTIFLGAWMLASCGGGSNLKGSADTRCDTEGAERCNGATVQTCSANLKWEDETTCRYQCQEQTGLGGNMAGVCSEAWEPCVSDSECLQDREEGHFCLDVEPLTGALAGRCVKECQANSECMNGEVCVAVALGAGGAVRGACSSLSGQHGETCGYTNGDFCDESAGLGCFDIGGAAVCYEECSPTDINQQGDCSSGQMCLTNGLWRLDRDAAGDPIPCSTDEQCRTRLGGLPVSFCGERSAAAGGGTFCGTPVGLCAEPRGLEQTCSTFGLAPTIDTSGLCQPVGTVEPFCAGVAILPETDSNGNVNSCDPNAMYADQACDIAAGARCLGLQDPTTLVVTNACHNLARVCLAFCSDDPTQPDLDCGPGFRCEPEPGFGIDEYFLQEDPASPGTYITCMDNTPCDTANGYACEIDAFDPMVYGTTSLCAAPPKLCVEDLSGGT